MELCFYIEGENDKRPSRFAIPKPPFVRRMLMEKWEHIIPAWRNVCPPNFKMFGDNPDHSDWMVGSDPIVPMESWYGSWNGTEDRPLKDALARKEEEFFAEYTGSHKDVFVLSGSGETDYLPVYQPTDENSRVECGDVLSKQHPDGHPRKPFILVVPSAHPSYSYLAMNAAAIITEVGGALCHLAVITREKNIPVVRVKDACKKYITGTTVRVSCSESSVEAF